MKRIFLALVVIALALPAMSQSPVNLGFKAGLNSSKFSTSADGYNKETINNFLAGAYLRINISSFYVQPEVYFNTKGGELKALEMKKSFDMNTVDVPLLAGYKLIDKAGFNIHVNAGPVLSFVTDKDMSDELPDTKFKDKIFGFQYGAGVDIGGVSLDLRIEHDGKSIDTDTLFKEGKTNSFLLTLGFKIF
ncbi:porin family protein [Puteibacter caeruleilacunae]|nr:porin family protein [Puteibacter caeruleilacunae]